jgi:hypothetical protein
VVAASGTIAPPLRPGVREIRVGVD